MRLSSIYKSMPHLINRIKTGACAANSLNKAASAQPQQLAQNQKHLHSSLTSSQQQATSFSSSRIVHEERTSSSSMSSSSKRLNSNTNQPQITTASEGQAANNNQQQINAQSSVTTRSNEVSEYSRHSPSTHKKTDTGTEFIILWFACWFAMHWITDELRPHQSGSDKDGKVQIGISVRYTFSTSYLAGTLQSIKSELLINCMWSANTDLT